MADNRLEYQISLTADTKQFNSNIKAALESLQDLGAKAGSQFTKELQEASQAASQLAIRLKNATDQETGKLNLTDFNNSLRRGGVDIKTYADKLSRLGPQGEQAFLQVARAITSAELPLKRSNKLLDNMWTTMKNTVRWQISSSVLTGFTGALQTAYYYAKDLNESLNNIRIVTGKTTDDMARFADQANKAAQALNTTTLDYSNASLIYYQQGLSDKEVQERTDATVKFANVSRQSAEQASEQLTSIWNNFADGSKSLEYYIDVMTKLGAETASSSEEISEGVQKFAATADAIGLSYEYATSALATVTATTRESADVVGNAYKTLFARIQGLKLGETLDDGTTLNKYSQALENVGINIFDQNQELKDMDTILDEMGNKWESLGKDQQVALAQTVAGVRQYNQLIALMDNWDFFQQNLASAYNAEGTLNEQAEIYAESWEAAGHRVRAALENIYDSLIDEDFFVGLDNFVTPFINTIATITDAVGGLNGILAIAGNLMFKVYGDKMASGMREIAISVGLITGKEQERLRTLQATTAKLAEDLTLSSVESDNIVYTTRLDMMRQEVNLQAEINTKIDSMSALEKEYLGFKQQEINFAKEATEVILQQLEAERERAAAREENLYDKGIDPENLFKTPKFDENKQPKTTPYVGSIKGAQANRIELGRVLGLSIKDEEQFEKYFKSSDKGFDKIIQKVKELSNQSANLKNFQNLLIRSGGEVKNLSEVWQNFGIKMGYVDKETKKLTDSYPQISNDIKNTTNDLGVLKIALIAMGDGSIGAKQAINSFITSLETVSTLTMTVEEKNDFYRQSVEKLLISLSQGGKIVTDWADRFITVGHVAMQAVMAFNAIKSMGEIFSDKDATTGEVILTVLTNMSMLLPILGQAMNALNKQKTISVALDTGTIAVEKKVVSQKMANFIATRLARKEKYKDATAEAADTAATIANTAAKIANRLALLGIVAALGLVVAGVVALANAQETEAEKTEKVIKSAQNMADAAESANQSAENLKSTIESYESARDTLKDCTMGTQEWRDALEQANDSAIKVIDSLQGLSGEEIKNLYSRQNGQLILDENALERAQKNMDKQASRIEYSSAVATYKSSQAEISDTINELINKTFGDFMISDQTMDQYYSDRVQEGLKEALTENLEYLSDSAGLGEFSERLQELITEPIKISEDNKETLDKMYNSVQDLANASSLAAEKLKLIAELKVDETLGDTYTELEKQVTAIKNTSYLNKERERQRAELAKTDNNYFDILQTLRSLGFQVSPIAETEEQKRIEGTGTDKNYNYLVDGEVKTYAIDDLASMIAGALADLRIEGQGRETKGEIERLDAESLDFLTKVTNGVDVEGNIDFSSFFSGLTPEEFEKLSVAFKEVDGEMTWVVDGFKQLGISLDEIRIILDMLGLSSDKFYEALQEQIAEGPLTSEQTARLEAATHNGLDLSGLDYSEIAKYTTSSLDFREELKNAGVEKFVNILKAFEDGQNSSEQLTNFFNGLKQTKFDASDAEEKIRKLSETYDIQGRGVDLLISQIKELDIAYYTSTGAIGDQAKALKEITGDGLEVGDIISPKQYQQLEDAGIDVSNYFSKMLDGTYELTGSAEQFSQVVRQITLEQLWEQVNKYSENRKNVAEEYGISQEQLQQGVYTENDGKAALEYIQSFKDMDWGELNLDSLLSQPIDDNLKLAQEDLDLINQAIQKINESESQTQFQLLASAETLSELYGLASGIEGLSEEAYGFGLIDLASQYESCTEEIEEYQKALSSGNATTKEAAKIQLEQAVEIGETAKQYNLDEKALKNYAKRLETAEDGTKRSKKAALDLATANTRLNRGISDLYDNLKDYTRILKNSDKDTEEYSQTMDSLKDMLADVFNVADGSMLSDNFVQQLIEDGTKLKAIANGDIDTINDLRMAVADDIVMNIRSEVDDAYTRHEVTVLWDWLKNNTPDLTVGTHIDGTDEFVTKLNEMIAAAGMTKKEVTSFLGSMGMSAKLKTTTVPQKMKVPTYKSVVKKTGYVPVTTGTDENGDPIVTNMDQYERYTVPVIEEVVGEIQTVSIDTTSGDTHSGGGIDIIGPSTSPNYSNTPSGRKSSGGGGGGGRGSSGGKKSPGTKQDKGEKKKFKDVEDRYHEITRAIQRQSDALDDLNNQLDRTYGLKRLTKYQKSTEELTKQIENYRKKLEEAERESKKKSEQGYLQRDRARVNNLFGKKNVNYGTNGEILNYNNLLKRSVNEYNAFIKEYNKFIKKYNKLSKEQQEKRKNQRQLEQWERKKERAEQKHENQLDALQQYEDTLNVIQEQKDAIEDLKRQIEDTKLEAISYELEIHLDVKNVKQEAKDFAKQIKESFGDELTHGLASATISNEQAQLEVGMLEVYQKQYGDLKQRMAEANEFTDVNAIIEQMKTLQSETISSGETLLEWIDSIETMLPNALEAASERFAEFTDQLEHNSAVVSSIKELIELQGETYKTAGGFEVLSNIINEQMNNSLANAVLQKDWYEKTKAQLQDAEKKLAASTEGQANYDTLKANRDALLAEMNEAEKAMLESAKQAMEAAQEMYTTAIEKAMYDFGQMVSGGEGLDLLQDKYDHYIETEERYFDKVNEAYQVSAWYDKLQKDIDNTTNAKHRDTLKALQAEIDVRRKNNTLSKYDLDILEAKYKVTQAQMALDDAQNAKNQLRLVRDSQGNWNYQYTADADKIAEAENQLASATNDWYNIAKQQAQDVTGEIIDAWQECQNDLKDIYTDMTLTDDERAKRAEEIYNYYVDKIKFLENEKNIAIKDMTVAGNASLFASMESSAADISDLTGATTEDIKNKIGDLGNAINLLLQEDEEGLKIITQNMGSDFTLFENTFAEKLKLMTANSGDFEKFFTEAWEKCKKALEQYRKDMDKISTDTGLDLETLKRKIAETTTSTDNLRKAGLEATKAMWESLKAIQEASVNYANLAKDILKVVEALKKLAETQGKDIGQYSGVDPKTPQTPGSSSPTSNLPSSFIPPMSEVDLPMEKIKLEGHFRMAEPPKGKPLMIERGRVTHLQQALKNTGFLPEDWALNPDDYYIKGSDTRKAIIALKKALGLKGTNGIFYHKTWDKVMKSGLSQYKTGGLIDYTGPAWVDGTKTQPELMLNAKDTQNLLVAIDAIRTIDPKIFANIEKILDQGANIGSTLMSQKLNGVVINVPDSNQAIEQHVTIEHVEFKEATTADEIKEAFATIVNDAAQWAKVRKD